MTQQEQILSDETSRAESARAEISREMVRLYKELFGRGPTKARTEFAGPDTVICTLENTFTPAERSLVEMGEHQRLRDTRMYFQAATSDRFREVVERVLGRKVRAFISGVDAGNDVCAEIFYLERNNSSREDSGRPQRVHQV
ncbi:MAG TPA: Na-translocating system protein MpsC family protein [Solirubrobacterales bacterium]|nr:Na-translocating system protein MpsC family protein [Solirubrobacterales bacterium]